MTTLTERPRIVEPESHPPRPRRFTASEYDAIIQAGILTKRRRVELRDGQILVAPADFQPPRATNGTISAPPDAMRPTPYRFNVDEYMKMAEIGIFVEGERVELMDGEIIEMAPIGMQHEANVDDGTRILVRAVGDRAIVRVQGSLTMDDGRRPQPDFMILKLREGGYRDRVAGPADVLLIIEVADSSLYRDRGAKLTRYAEAGIPEVWIENIPDRVIEAHRNPVNGEYTESRTYRPGETINPIAFPDVPLSASQILGVER